MPQPLIKRKRPSHRIQFYVKDRRDATRTSLFARISHPADARKRGRDVAYWQILLRKSAIILNVATNAIFEVIVFPYGLAAPLVISMRGTRGERNPVQVAIGQWTLYRCLQLWEFWSSRPIRHGGQLGRPGRSDALLRGRLPCCDCTSNNGPYFFFGSAMRSTAATALGIADALPERDVIALVATGSC
jgi:hypothetical protein